jgi:hypothetical protein
MDVDEFETESAVARSEPTRAMIDPSPVRHDAASTAHYAPSQRDTRRRLVVNILKRNDRTPGLVESLAHRLGSIRRIALNTEAPPAADLLEAVRNPRH